MQEFISEPITPGGARTDTSAMATGEPDLPAEFNWRGRTYTIAAKLQQWKGTSSEGGRAGGEVYLRRHYYTLRMSDASTWTVYFVRHTPRGGQTTNRWFLYKIN